MPDTVKHVIFHQPLGWCCPDNSTRFCWAFLPFCVQLSGVQTTGTGHMIKLRTGQTVNPVMWKAVKSSSKDHTAGRNLLVVSTAHPQGHLIHINSVVHCMKRIPHTWAVWPEDFDACRSCEWALSWSVSQGLNNFSVGYRAAWLLYYHTLRHTTCIVRTMNEIRLWYLSIENTDKPVWHSFTFEVSILKASFYPPLLLQVEGHFYIIPEFSFKMPLLPKSVFMLHHHLLSHGNLSTV